MLRKDGIEGFSNRTLGSGKAFADGVCTITEKRQNTLSSQLSKTRQIKGITEYRGVINLEVSGMHDDAGRSKQSQRCGICNAVVGLDEFHTETAQIHRLTMFYHFALGALH